MDWQHDPTGYDRALQRGPLPVLLRSGKTRSLNITNLAEVRSVFLIIIELGYLVALRSDLNMLSLV